MNNGYNRPFIFGVIFRFRETKIFNGKLLIFSYLEFLAYVLGAQNNCPFEYPQHMFRLKNKMIIFLLHTLD